jgi:hypothetical protein
MNDRLRSIQRSVSFFLAGIPQQVTGAGAMSASVFARNATVIWAFSGR